MGKTDEREYGSDTRESAADDVEGHGLTGTPTELPPADRASDETDDDVEAHGMIGTPTETPTD